MLRSYRWRRMTAPAQGGWVPSREGVHRLHATAVLLKPVSLAVLRDCIGRQAHSAVAIRAHR